LLLVLEDLQWGDAPTVQFLDVALRELRERPLCVLALARPEVHELFPTLWAERSIHEVSLKQLGRKASEQLVRHVLGEGMERGLVDRLVRLAEGNAFYLEELIRAAAEGKQRDLPETVVAMVQSRLDALAGESRRILRAASVFGEVFWPGAVARLLGEGAGAAGIGPRLEELVNQELILRRKQSQFADEVEFAFRHALLREGAYIMLTAEDRVLGHRLAGEWLEQHGEQDPLVLAEHFERGGDGARAGLHYLRAAEHASQGGDIAAVIARAQRALASNMPDELRTRCLGMLCELLYFRMNLQSDAVPYAQEVLRVAQPGTGPWSQGMLLTIVYSLQVGMLDEFEAQIDVVAESRPVPGAATPWSLCIGTGIYLLDLLGRPRGAERLLGVLAEVARDRGADEPAAPALWHCMRSLRVASAEDDPRQGLEDGEAFRRISETMGHRRHVGLATSFIGMNRWYLGAFEGTDRMIEEVSVQDDDTGLVSALRPFVLAWLAADRGAIADAQRWASRLVADSRTRGVPLDEGRGQWVLAEVQRRAGQLDAADAAIEAALAILRLASPGDTPGALATLAAIRLAQGRTADALAAAAEGVEKDEAMGACGFFRGAFLRLTHAECLEAAGDHEAAKVTIAAARARLFAIAAKISEAEYRRSFLEAVPENRRTLELARQWVGPDEPS
jgi:hypothetical protein